MQCSVEISMYPLKKEFKKPIIEFIKKLRKHSEIIVQTNEISTQVFGDYDNISKALNQEIKNSFKNNKSIVFNMKIINSDLQEIPVF
jgi:uncharacterized protein YqgV (UPF0045/DUF77 family)